MRTLVSSEISRVIAITPVYQLIAYPAALSLPIRNVPANCRFQRPPLRKLPFQLRHEPRHLLLELLLIFVALRRLDIATWRDRVPVRPHLLHGRHVAETRVIWGLALSDSICPTTIL